MAPPAPDPGSFRDPTNRVLLDGERVLRGLRGEAAADFAALLDARFFTDGVARGRIVGTKALPEVPAVLAEQGWTAVLEHERVPVVSYPYEWPFGMLKDAALLQLDLTLAALEDGFITKDATPYNVQFLGSRPVHIDVGSFERLAPGEPWFGHRQFSELFLHPLLLTAHRGITHQAALRGALGGVSAADCAAALGRAAMLRPSMLVHVGLHASAERKRTAPTRDVRGELKAAGFGREVISAQVRKLRRLVASLEWGASTSVWSGYSDRAHYADEGLERKAEFVRRVAGARRRRQVLDLGANDGHFARLVLPEADHVVAVDQDPLVIDQLYRDLRATGEERILPLTLDLTDLTGGLGWRGRERAAFTDRVRPDLVLCLALVHHLVISASIPIEEVVDFLAGFGTEVVLEFPTPDDEMVQVLASQKRDQEAVAERYAPARLEAALDTRFGVEERATIGTRVLYHLRPHRTAGGAQPAEARLAASDA